MRAAPNLTAIGTALWLAGTAAHAVGFGRIANNTQLGQPLNFSAVIRLDADESLARECVTAEVQSGENKLQPGQVRVTLEGTADSLERSVRVTTSALIDEPVVTVSVTLGCNARMTRKFVAFVDPPQIYMAQSAPVETLPVQRMDSQVAPLVAMLQGGDTSTSGARRAEPFNPSRSRSPDLSRDRVRKSARVAVAETSRSTELAAPAPRPRAAPALSRQPAATRRPNAGPRLQLEAAAPLVTSSASAPIVMTAAEAAVPVIPTQTDAQLAQDRARMQSLEEGIAKLRAESQATNATLADLQIRLREAHAGHDANPLVYALATLSALLALALAGLWWRQGRTRRTAQWWVGPTPVAATLFAPLAADATPPVSLPEAPAVSAAQVVEVSGMVTDEEQPVFDAPPTRPTPFLATAPAPAPSEILPNLPRELSVEELIDLEQQVEFFIVLGQDDAAIELLMSHVRSDGGISPLPYLKLLEIYRRRGEHDAYHRIRDRFNRRFNAYAPAWEADLQHGRSLVDYPDTTARLQQLWVSPASAMETLDASLFRRDQNAETFDLPAYRELLLLYAIARDLAEHAGLLTTASVDLLLPLGEPLEKPAARLSAVAPSIDFQNSSMTTMPLDLDVTFVPASTHHLDTTPSALRRSANSRFSGDSIFVDLELDVLTAPVKAPKVGGNR